MERSQIFKETVLKSIFDSESKTFKKKIFDYITDYLFVIVIKYERLLRIGALFLRQRKKIKWSSMTIIRPVYSFIAELTLKKCTVQWGICLTPLSSQWKISQYGPWINKLKYRLYFYNFSLKYKDGDLINYQWDINKIWLQWSFYPFIPWFFDL